MITSHLFDRSLDKYSIVLVFQNKLNKVGWLNKDGGFSTDNYIFNSRRNAISILKLKYKTKKIVHNVWELKQK